MLMEKSGSTVAVRLPLEAIRRINAILAYYESQTGGVPIPHAPILRRILMLGLGAYEQVIDAEKEKGRAKP